MAFTLASTIKDGVGMIDLGGSLDAASAPQLQAAVQQDVNEHIKRLVLNVKALEYIASAGLRAILFAKQKMGSDADIYLIAPQEQVLETLQRSGFDQAVIIQDEYTA